MSSTVWFKGKRLSLRSCDPSSQKTEGAPSESSAEGKTVRLSDTHRRERHGFGKSVSRAQRLGVGFSDFRGQS